MKKIILGLFAFGVIAISAMLAKSRSSPQPPRLQYITTAHQGGPVGYRDPPGVISPDGVWLAYISNRHLFLHRIEGALTTELLPADDMKVNVWWFPDSTHLAVQEEPYNAVPRWFRYDIAT